MGNIYFIRNNDKVKIGFSKNVKRRKSTLQTGNGEKLIIEYIIENVNMTFEKHVHSVCSGYLIQNEWFRDDVLSHLLAHPWFKENMKIYSSS